MAKKSLVIDLDDPKTDRIADVISNKTAKKIISLLAEREMSGSEIAGSLKIPLNTVTYNLGKLVSAGLVEKSKKVFWSSKGRRMDLYSVSNKQIVISPRRMARGILPAGLVALVGALGIKFFGFGNSTGSLRGVSVSEPLIAEVAEESAGFAGSSAGVTEGVASDAAVSKVAELVPEVPGVVSTVPQSPEIWAWFLLGALIALFVVLIVNWRKGS